jgi:hypothetical protein
MLTASAPSTVGSGPSSGGGRVSLGPKTFFPLVNAGRIAVRSHVYPTGITGDGTGLVLSDGSVIEAGGGAIIAATGFTSSWNFIRGCSIQSVQISQILTADGAPSSNAALEERVRLGIEPTEPQTPAADRSPTDGYMTLADPPGPPSHQPASHVYKGIVPTGAWDERDLCMNGFAALLGAPYSSEITAHWIADFFTGSPHLRLPQSAKAAWQAAEDHAEWLRHRYPLSSQPWATNTAVPLLNAQVRLS